MFELPVLISFCVRGDWQLHHCGCGYIRKATGVSRLILERTTPSSFPKEMT
jgi:hypothetical protein